MLVLPYHRGRNDTGRHRDNRVADKHNYRRQEAPHRRNGRYIAITDRGHGYNRPVNAIRNVVERRAGLHAFNHVHDRAHGRYKNQHKKEKDKDFGRAHPEGTQKQVPFLDEKEQLEYPENTDQAEGTNDKQIVRTMQEKAQIDRQGSQQIDYAEKAEHIFKRLFQAIHARQVLYGEKQRKHVFHYPQGQIGRTRENMHALQNDQQHTENDAANQNNVEHFPLRGIRLKNDGVDFLFQLIVVQKTRPTPAKL